MAYKALKTFAGAVSMRRGEIKDISNETIVKDLLKAGYIEDLSDKPKSKSSKSTKKGGETNV